MAERTSAQVVLRRVRAAAIRILLPILFIGMPVVVLLEAVPDHNDQALVPDNLGWQVVSVPLRVMDTANGRRTARLTFRHDEADKILAHQDMSLLMATLHRRPRLVSATVRLSGSSCAYVAESGGRIEDNTYLAFRANEACSRSPVVGEAVFELEVVFADAERLDVWAYVAPTREDARPYLQLAEYAPRLSVPRGARLAIRGRLHGIETGRAVPRITLLNYVWQVSPRATWIWVCVACASGLLIAGTFLFPWHSDHRRRAWRAAVGSACGAGALALLYAVLVPPFHAPDEPDHFLSYAQLIDEPRLAREAEAWARLGHLERIRFHSEEAFRVHDVGNPFAIPWSAETFADDTAARSATVAALWRVLGRPTSGLPAPRVFLTLRLVHAGVFALCVGLAALVLTWPRSEPYPQLGVFTAFFVPTIPFFAMQVSEFGLLTSLYLLLAGVILAVFLDSPRTHGLGFPLGLASALVFASGRSAGPTFVVLALTLVGRTVLGSRGAGAQRDKVRHAAVFWGGFVAGASVFVVLATPHYREELVFITSTYERLAWARGLVDVVTHQSWWIPVGGAVGLVFELLWSFARGRWSWRWVERVLALSGFAGAAALIVGLGLSLFVAFPTLIVLEVPQPPGVGHYVRLVCAVMATSFRFGSPDYLLVTTFFSGFGWLDTFPREGLVRLLVLLGGISGTTLVAWLSWKRDSRRLAMLGALTLGLGVMLALNAAASRGMDRNLHGRYLIGWYTVLLSLAWSAAAMIPAVEWRRIPVRVPRTVWLFTLAGSAHAYCLTVILQRYF